MERKKVIWRKFAKSQNVRYAENPSNSDKLLNWLQITEPNPLEKIDTQTLVKVIHNLFQKRLTVKSNLSTFMKQRNTKKAHFQNLNSKKEWEKPR